MSFFPSSLSKACNSYIFKNIISAYFNRLPLSGRYFSFDEALSHCSGYDDIVILQHVKTAVEGLLNGRGIYERDGFLFESIPIDLSIRQWFTRIIKPGDHILDFGGALGGTYFSNKDILPPNVNYCVIEQQNFVELGTKMFLHSDAPIQFLSDLSQYSHVPDIAILSGVLQYIPNCYELLMSISQLSPKFILIDRTAFGSDKYWRLQLNKGIYPVDIQYPHRCIVKSKLFECLVGYNFVASWKNSFDPNHPEHSGLLFERDS